ncbi:flagellar operon protein, putative [Heliomicrobium modesticaldum Ice1]|uniref:Flagellar operon protein, putative n=1 Tax=Heliobacterium modesticaldum (strain ATCC 51547 / Ice1) TaxID=498761 RepID=B0THB0_HELMI|nr:TIGR02530 family flagellar biosynthesis protein [Heliomicrobium modesticaldum]ABZ84785.1 flagellar operon protein, putative [Heliomicrobium modesticaldum Ice1]
MDHRILYRQPLIPGVGKAKPGSISQPTGQISGDSFQKILDQKSLKFSSHALQRLAQRNISLGEAELGKLNDAVDKAGRKGSKESLILMKDLALVVSVKNRTVITAVDGKALKDNVFTNIDSAVVITE